MTKIKKERVIYFRLATKLAEQLDRRIARVGYTSRSEFFTAVSYVALYGSEYVKQPQIADETEHIAKLPKSVTKWVSQTMPRVSEEEIYAGLHSVISEMLVPVIAMKGVDVAYENTWGDVRDVYHSRSGIWVTESDVREAFVSFAAVHRGELVEYRERQMQGGSKGNSVV